MLNKLIIVAGHSIYIGKDFNNIYDDKNWFLFPFQAGEPKFYIEHIIKGTELLNSDKNALLIFTGGQTRKEAGFRSEAVTYYEIADHLNLFNEESKERVTTEEFSRDSFENLLFPICRFREYLGYYPTFIDFVTFGFKERRFWMHVEAIKFPKQNVRFFGPNNPEDLDLALKGEEKVIQAISKDPYQTNGELLLKRNARNPHRKQNGYAISCPELKELLNYTGTEIFPGKLPWEN